MNRYETIKLSSQIVITNIVYNVTNNRETIKTSNRIVAQLPLEQ